MEKYNENLLKNRPSIILKPNNAIKYGLNDAILYSALCEYYNTKIHLAKDGGWILWVNSILDKYFPFWTKSETADIVERVRLKGLISIQREGGKYWVISSS